MEPFIQFLKSNEWLALVAAFVGVTTLLKTIVELIDTIKKLFNEASPLLDRLVRFLQILLKKPLFYFSLTGFLIAAVILLAPPSTPLAEQYTKQVFDALTAKNYDEVIRISNECIDIFKPGADNLQAEFQSKQIPMYPVGKVDNPVLKQEIFNNGALNTAAGCYWAKGRAYHFKGDLNQAKDAYLTTSRYTYGRVYDRSGDFFWSPADDAAARAKQLP